MLFRLKKIVYFFRQHSAELYTFFVFRRKHVATLLNCMLLRREKANFFSLQPEAQQAYVLVINNSFRQKEKKQYVYTHPGTVREICLKLHFTLG
jgi:hypothetical protein